jgi:hypothetical protein
MKERPILFQGAMVRAILAGSKTQTRRIVDLARMPRWPELHPEMGDILPLCPYGQPGDRLWVRENARCDYRGETPPEKRGTIGVSYQAGGGRMQPYTLDRRDDYPWFPRLSHNIDGSMRWAPGIHMPRWASRILLEVTGVRVERLQAISTRDCWAEGIPASPDVNPIHEYEELWESINGAGSWAANPWVWVVEFRRVT